MKKDAAKDIKIAFFDVDGTLVDMEKKIISPKMIETLKRLKKNGIIFLRRMVWKANCVYASPALMNGQNSL